MRTVLYVDGFNLYYRMLLNRPQLKWLDLKRLGERVLDPANEIVAIKYYTARVSGKFDPEQPARQQIYLDALGTIPEVSVHYGQFLYSKKFAGLVHPPEFRPVLSEQMPLPWPEVVYVHKAEEKGSDVNLASHLLLGAFTNEYDVAVVLSNDTDLIEPMRIVKETLGKVVGLMSPVSNPSPNLVKAATFVRRISVSDLAVSQFPEQVQIGPDTFIARPASWY